MARPDSIGLTQGIKAPTVPDDFPLSAHLASGQWRKTLRRRDYYFGKLVEWQAALDRYNHDWPYILRGQTAPPMPVAGGVSIVTLGEVVNRYVVNERERYTRGEIGFAMYDEAARSGQDLLDYLDEHRDPLSVPPNEWADFKHWMKTSPGTADAPRRPLGPYALKRRIGCIRSMSRWASHEDVAILTRGFRFGAKGEFATVPKAVFKDAKIAKLREYGAQTYDAAEIQKILDLLDDFAGDKTFGGYAKVKRAMVLLGLNAGYTQIDLAELTMPVIVWDHAVIDYQRPKLIKRAGGSGTIRIAPMWPRTVEALQDAMRYRPKPASAEYEQHVFLTRRGLPFSRAVVREDEPGRLRESKRDAIGEEFAKILKQLGLKRCGLNFKGLRNTFSTIGGGAGDTDAREVVMGHAQDEMWVWYEQFGEEMTTRCRRVTDYVENRLFGSVGQLGNPAAAALARSRRETLVRAHAQAPAELASNAGPRGRAA